MIPADHLVIRPATMADLESLTTFSAAMALETEGRELDRTRLRLGTQAVLEHPEHGRFFIADLQSAPFADRVTIGQMLLTYEWSDWRNAQFWWIQSVYVHPDWRRRGVYRRMHHTIIESAHETPGVCGVRLYVARDNHVAKQVYRRVGLDAATYDIYESDFVLSPHRDNTPHP